MQAQIGDSIVVGPKKLTQPARAGVVEEVLRQEPLRLRVRWQDGHESVFAPTDGVAQITQARRKPNKSTQRQARTAAVRRQR